MSEVKVISNLNNRHSVFYGFVKGVLSQNPNIVLIEIARYYIREIDDTVEEQTLIRRYNEVKSSFIRYKGKSI